jgi:hypothetical protein
MNNTITITRTRVILKGLKLPVQTVNICTGKSSRTRGHFLPAFTLENGKRYPVLRLIL